jgi:hypothetical protein
LGKNEKSNFEISLINDKKSLLKKQLADRQVLQNAEKLLCKYVILKTKIEQFIQIFQAPRLSTNFF